MNDVLAIVICFHPDHLRLRKLIDNLDKGASKIILFDNGGLRQEELGEIRKKIDVVTCGRNVGLGEPLNYGCDVAAQGGYRFVISFDQDSSPPPEMIDSLRRELLAYQAIDTRAVAIGPQLVDRRWGGNHIIPFTRFERFRALKWSGEGTEPVSHLITSGCMIDVSQWMTMDRFSSELFIDCVDNNWSWRTIRRGYLLLGTSRAIMPHEISEKIERKSVFSVNKYSPIRRFFQMRNSAYHLLHEHLTLAQRLFVIRAMMVVFVSIVTSDASPIKSLRQCARGLMHGVIGKLGPLE